TPAARNRSSRSRAGNPERLLGGAAMPRRLLLIDCEKEPPVRGMPVVTRGRRLPPTVSFAPFGPIVVDRPDLLTFNVMPGPMLMRLRKLKPMAIVPPSTGSMIAELGRRHPRPRVAPAGLPRRARADLEP